MKIRMLAAIGGTFHGIEGGVKRGQIVDVDEDNAKRYIAGGLATARLKGELAQPYEPTEESEGLRDEVMKRLAAQRPPETLPRPGAEPIGRHPAYPRQRVEGWV